jgi:hypothetical protein
MPVVEEVPVIWIESLWHFVFGWPAIDMLVGVAAIAIAALEPPLVAAIIPDLRKWAICVAVVAFTFLSISGKFYHDGLAEKQRQWDVALSQEVTKGEQARTDAESTVRNAPTDGVRNDPRNRDNWGKRPDGRAARPVRWLAAHRLFGAKR